MNGLLSESSFTFGRDDFMHTMKAAEPESIQKSGIRVGT